MLIFILVAFLSTSVNSQCNPKIGDHQFDLTPSLNKQIAVKSGVYVYNSNLCGIADNCNGTICQFRSTGTTSPLAVIAKTGIGTWSYIDDKKPELGIKLQTKTGDRCWGKGPRIATIKFLCAANNAADALMTVVTDTGPSCSGDGYQFSMSTPCACKGGCSAGLTSILHGGGLSSSWKFNLFVFFALAVYLGGGCFYNKHMNGAVLGSKDAIPNKEFWETVPNLVREGCIYSYIRARAYMSKDAVPYDPVDQEGDQESQGLLHDEEDDPIA